ncbi:hypothetical protein RIF29_42381 [Crotalaria pallida]|uniref:WRKY domain-containing protein n=1 Tax=Crotalaria pallida TaxID=3830 RepID=A0AAN9E6U8_CROPI
MDYYFVNPHPDPIPNYAHHSSNNMAPSSSEFILSDYLMLDDGVDHDHQESWSQSTESSEKTNYSDVTHGFNGATSKNNNIKCKSGNKCNKAKASSRIAFRTKSELEIMDDGYKWRKYGKKSVKNSPHLRNYYKCSSEGCNVKKTVERDRDDSSYVITTYNSVHNHESPFTVACYSQISFVHSSHT